MNKTIYICRNYYYHGELYGVSIIFKFSTIEDMTLYVTAQLQKQTTHPRIICRGHYIHTQTLHTQTFLLVFFKIFRDSSHSLQGDQILQLCHFPILLSVNSKNAVYDHVVVIWQGRVIDYESENIYMLTKESLQQICGANMFFSHVSCGYGLFSPAGIRALSPEITNWGKK